MLFSFLPSVLHFSHVWPMPYFLYASTWNTLLSDTYLPDMFPLGHFSYTSGTLSGHFVVGHIYWDIQHDSLRIKANLDTPFDREMLNFIKVGSRPGQGCLSCPGVARYSLLEHIVFSRSESQFWVYYSYLAYLHCHIRTRIRTRWLQKLFPLHRVKPRFWSTSRSRVITVPFLEGYPCLDREPSPYPAM